MQYLSQDDNRQQKARKPFPVAGFLHFNGHQKTSKDFKMVEAAGVEPASENTPLPYLHA
jgi:hypothetical protein